MKYFGEINDKEITSKFGIKPRDVKVYVDQLHAEKLTEPEDVKRSLNVKLGMPKLNEYQQYSEQNLKDALFAYASQSMSCAQILNKYYIPEKTLRNKRSELLTKLQFTDKSQLLELISSNPEYVKDQIKYHTWKGVTKLPMLTKSEVNLVNTLEDQLDQMGFGKSSKGMQKKYLEVVKAKGEAIEQVIGVNTIQQL